MPDSEWPALREVIREAVERWWEAATRPSHTDLMVPPEGLHEYIEKDTIAT